MRIFKFTVLLCALVTLAGCFQNPSTSTPQSNAFVEETRASQHTAVGGDNNNLLLGNPSRAGRDSNNFLLERPQHAMSYNKSNGGPNWVSWHLEKSDLGNVRRGDFLPDPMLPADMQIRPTDYRGSGYDRGHVCPSGDRTRTKTDNTATFVMSNMLPQAAALNQRVWSDLESYERSLTKTNELYIIAGGNGSAERIAKGKVNVPSVCWKILVVLPRGDNDLKRIDANTRVIAVSMPNRERQEIADSKWSQWITSIDQLQKTTGYDFLSALPDDIERALEKKQDSGRATASRPAASDNSRLIQNDSQFQPGKVSTIPRIERAVPATDTQPTTVQQPSSQVAEQPGATTQVWVNLKSGVYHLPGARWYGRTKEGTYMAEAQAIAQGYRAAQNGQ